MWICWIVLSIDWCRRLFWGMFCLIAHDCHRDWFVDCDLLDWFEWIVDSPIGWKFVDSILTQWYYWLMSNVVSVWFINISNISSLGWSVDCLHNELVNHYVCNAHSWLMSLYWVVMRIMIIMFDELWLIALTWLMCGLRIEWMLMGVINV